LTTKLATTDARRTDLVISVPKKRLFLGR
jgi:hypothetical protein